MQKELTAERLTGLLHYNSETGHFTWLVNKSRQAKIGKRAGGLDGNGYIRIRIDGRYYQASSLAIFYMTGAWPLIDAATATGPDHIDGDKINNRYDNLREATKQENGFNRKRYVTNTSGFKGVTWNARLGKWRAKIGHLGKRYSLGCYGSKEEAYAAYQAEAERLFGEFKRHDAGTKPDLKGDKVA